MTEPRSAAAPITSAANPRLRAALDLRERRGRDRASRLLVDGSRELTRALDGGHRVLEAFVDADGLRNDESDRLLGRLADLGVPLVAVAGAAIDRLAYGDRHSGIVAVVAAPPSHLADLDLRIGEPLDPLVVVVEDVEKPGNLGAIARSADGAGAAALIAATERAAPADPWNPNAIRASLGTVLTLPLAVAATGDVVAWLRARSFSVVAARVQASVPYPDADLRGRVAIALGSEAVGLSEAWTAVDILGVRIPMLGRADSLNVSTAAAVLLYEARRQREAADRATTSGDRP